MNMHLPSQVPDLSYDSRSCSVYTEDDLVSEVNSNGTQIHHRSHLHPTVGGMARDYGQIFERPSDLSLSQDNPTLNPDGSTMDLHNVSVTKTQYRFESEREATLRRLEQRSQNCKEREEHLQVWKERLLQVCAQDTAQEVNEARLSPYSWNFDDEWFLQDHSELGSSESSSLEVHISVPSAASSHPLPGSTATQGSNIEAPIQSGEGHMESCSEVLNAAEYQGSMIENLSDGPPVEADIFSDSGRKYGLRDHMRGYASGEYVTGLGGYDESPQENRKKRKWVKKIFCL